MVAIEQAEAQQLLARTAEAVVIVDARQPHLPILATNPTCHAALPPYTVEPLGQPWAEIFPQAAAHGLATIIRRAIATGEPCAIPGLVLPAHDNAPLAYCDWQCRPLAERDGTVKQVAILSTKAHRLAGHRQGPDFPVAAQPPLGFALVAGPEHTFVFANVALAALLGRSTPAPAGQPLFALYPALAQTPLAEALAVVRATAQPQTIDSLRVPGRQGGFCHWALRLLPTPGGDEHPGGILLVVSDITAQEDVAQAIAVPPPPRPRAAQFAALLDAIPDGAIVLDRAGTLDATNPAARQLLALPAEATGLALGDFFAPPRVRYEDGQPCDFTGDILTPILAGAASIERTIVIAAAEGEMRLALKATPISDDDGAVGGAVLLARDVTAQQQAEREKDAFLSLIAHELRSPLTSIKGFAQLAVRALDGLAAERARRHLHIIDQQTERIGRLIGDISDVSRLQRGKLTLNPMPFDLVPIVEATVSQQRVTTTSHTITLTLADEPLIVRADPARIELSLANLLANAAHFSPADSEIAVTLERHGDAAHLSVRDWGIGVPPAERRQIFERFYRATNGGGSGLGLGLFIADQIVARSGGTITVHDAAGGGAHFRLTLPLARPKADEAD
jgi:signal transduction histidine kinase